MAKEAVQFSIAWWKNRHAIGYFPTMEQHWDWKLYEAMPEWWLEFAEPMLTDSALEVGCGYGQWMAPCSKLVRDVVGVDIHESLLEKFEEQMGPFSNATMKLGDGTTLPFPSKRFSLVYSISVFQHIPRATVQLYLHEIARVLRRTGRAVLHFRGADGIGEYSEDIVVNHTGDWSVGWTVEEGIQAVEEAGMRVTKHSFGQSLILRAEFPQ